MLLLVFALAIKVGALSVPLLSWVSVLFFRFLFFFFLGGGGAQSEKLSVKNGALKVIPQYCIEHGNYNFKCMSIPTAHDFCVISAQISACTYTTKENSHKLSPIAK